MSDSPYHGYKFLDTEEEICIGWLPGRKQVCLYTIDSAGITVLAFFKTEQKAQRALAMIDRLAGAGR